jgi:hypothetical protein
MKIYRVSCWSDAEDDAGEDFYVIAETTTQALAKFQAACPLEVRTLNYLKGSVIS